MGMHIMIPKRMKMVAGQPVVAELLDPTEKIDVRRPASRGLGDTVEKMTRKMGIKPCCGCKKRRDWLNKKIPYRT